MSLGYGEIIRQGPTNSSGHKRFYIACKTCQSVSLKMIKDAKFCRYCKYRRRPLSEREKRLASKFYPRVKKFILSYRYNPYFEEIESLALFSLIDFIVFKNHNFRNFRLSLFCYIREKIVKTLHRNCPRELIYEPSYIPEDPLIVEDLLSKLKPLEAQIIKLHYIEGYEFKEIAQIKNISLSYVEKLSKRSLNKLRDGTT